MLPLLAACAGGGTVAPSPGPVTAADAEFEALYRERIEAAQTRFTEADVHFVTGMIGHHAQALVMSSLVPDRATDPQLRILARRIMNGQQDEIATMQQWLADRGQPVPEIEIRGVDLAVHGADHALHMPGMLTQDQLDELEASSGQEFDRRFLALMIQHHEGAVTMVEELFRTDGAGQDEAVFRLASDIQVDQRTEIARMQQMLDELSAAIDQP